MLSTLFGILDLFGRYRSDIEDLASIFIHETSRAMLDRFIDPIKHAEYYSQLTSITRAAFGLNMTWV